MDKIVKKESVENRKPPKAKVEKTLTPKQIARKEREVEKITKMMNKYSRNKK